MFIKKVGCLIILLLLTNYVFAFDHSHKSFNAILQKYVKIHGKQSLFDYKSMKHNNSKLPIYLKSISAVNKKEYKKFLKKQKLAFLINAYNGFTIQLILDNYPVKSIKDIGSFFSSTWKKKFFTFLGKKSHLDNIEHGMIRKQFNEPRIHFAVNCASIGCPSLQAKAFTEHNLEELLEAGTKNFLSNKVKNRLNKKNKKLKLSKIFKWYGEDFEKKFGSIEKFVAKYMSKDIVDQKAIAQKMFEIDWTDYDWSLNKVE
ncbi:MAG: DUF547 domain-containing protein [Bdellovibrionaceae bacterium]|jgi:hypothetical protein|nr:DUF547 domain-containing protein [Pseudobdellovibrionaceae bacterium]